MGEVDIVLVDSGSTDGTMAIASRYPVRVVTISPQDFTFGRSLNLGCRAAKADLIVVASAHVYPVYPDWLERLLEPFQDRRVAMTYGKQRGDERTRFSEGQIFHKWFPETSVAWQDHPFCNNANAAIRKALWKQHPFDESLPALEDIEWATWATSRGRGLAYVAEAEVVHVHDETPREVFGRYRREAMALRRIHPHTHFRVTDLVRLFLANIVSDGRHAWREGRPGKVAAEVLWFRWMQFWGTYRGFSLVGPLTQELRQAFYYPRGQTGGSSETPRDVRPLDYGRGADLGRAVDGEASTAGRAERPRSRSYHG
jgi:glycosyltransferase involved in cell wall biosynthesis